MDTNTKKQLLDLFYQFLTDERKEKIDDVLSKRTRYLTVGLENIFQSQNASAVIRSAECLGVQDLHVIQSSYEFNPNKHVVKGSNKWVDINYYEETTHCLNQLKDNGYRVIATSPGEHSVPISELKVEDGPMALIFGTELDGVSEEVLKTADQTVRLPMYGFTESYNISVSAALAINELYHKIIKSDLKWQLSSDEIDDLKLKWARSSVARSEIIEKEFLSNLA